MKSGVNGARRVQRISDTFSEFFAKGSLANSAAPRLERNTVSCWFVSRLALAHGSGDPRVKKDHALAHFV
mgnify:CR=1 FL=1